MGPRGGQTVQGLGGKVQLGNGLDWLHAPAGPLLVVVLGGGGAFKVTALLDTEHRSAGLSGGTLRVCVIGLRCCQKVHLFFRRDIGDKSFGEHLGCWPSLVLISKLSGVRERCVQPTGPSWRFQALGSFSHQTPVGLFVGGEAVKGDFTGSELLHLMHKALLQRVGHVAQLVVGHVLQGDVTELGQGRRLTTHGVH